MDCLQQDEFFDYVSYSGLSGLNEEDRVKTLQEINDVLADLPTILAYKAIVTCKSEHLKNWLKEKLQEYDTILKQYFLIRFYENTYSNIQELKSLYKSIKDIDAMKKELGLKPEELSNEASIDSKNPINFKENIDDVIKKINDPRLIALWYRLLMPEVLSQVGVVDAADRINLPMYGGFPVEAAQAASLCYDVRLVAALINIGYIGYFTTTDEARRVSKLGRMWEFISNNKYRLINDVFWGADNTLEYLNAHNVQCLGGVGNFLAMGLFAMDFVVSVCCYREESAAYKTQKEKLKNKLANYKVSGPDETDTDATETKINANLQSRAQLELDQLDMSWKYKNIKLIQDMMYALCLCIGFGLYCLCPPAILGAGLLAGVSLVYSITNPYLDILQGQAKTKLIGDEVEKKQAFISSQAQEIDVANLQALDPAIKMACIDLLMYEQQKAREEIITYNKQQLIKITTVLNMIMPVFAFACLLTLPTGIGFGVMAGITIFVVGAAFLYHYQFGVKKVPDIKPDDINDGLIKNLLEDLKNQKTQESTKDLKASTNEEDDGRGDGVGIHV